MKIDRQVAKQLFLEIGWNSASDKKMSNDAWVQEKLNAVPKNMPDDESEFEDPAAKALANAICKALEDGEEIEFELEGEVETVSEKSSKGKKGAKVEEKPAKGKKGTKTAATKETKSAKKSSGGAPTKDGTSIKSRLFAALSKKTPKTMKELMESANIEKPQSGYLKAWVDEKIVTKTDKGYVLA